MDKETLSNYGWIVICVLVLAVMIALATPFGSYVKDAVWNTTDGLNSTQNIALGAAGLCSHEYPSEGFTHLCTKCNQAKEHKCNFVDGFCTLCNAEQTTSFGFSPETYLAQTGIDISTTKDLVVPKTFRGTDGVLYKVTSIKTDGFRDCTNLETIVLPDSITYIGMDSFSGCLNLKSINIPESATVHFRAFQDCASLVTIKLPDKTTHLYEDTFNGCTSLENIDISNITYIGGNAFKGCSSLKSIKISEIGTRGWRVAQEMP